MKWCKVHGAHPAHSTDTCPDRYVIIGYPENVYVNRTNPVVWLYKVVPASNRDVILAQSSWQGCIKYVRYLLTGEMS